MRDSGNLRSHLNVLLAGLVKYVNPPLWGWKSSRMILPLEGYPSSSSQEWEPLARISKNIQLAVMATEDQKFPHHHGVDLDSLFKVISGSRREHSFTRSEYDQPTNGEERVLVSFSFLCS
jgi:hypothetical protein